MSPLLWKTPRRTFDVTNRGLIMGILNVTPDSFSDGGRYDGTEAAVERALQMLTEGAEIIDIGGESTRPGAAAVPAEEEAARVLPVIAALRQRSDCVISVDTMKAAVAAAAMEAGADIINDISGLQADPEMAAVAARTGAGVVLMHMQGTPRTMQVQPHYGDVIAEVRDGLAASLDQALAVGVALESIVLDPGIGFGKTLEHNLEILRQVEAFAVRGRPVLLGVSRKSFIGRVLGSTDPAAREWPTVALTSFAREKGVRILRVHDVLRNAQALRMTEAILGVPADAV